MISQKNLKTIKISFSEGLPPFLEHFILVHERSLNGVSIILDLEFRFHAKRP